MNITNITLWKFSTIISLGQVRICIRFQVSAYMIPIQTHIQIVRIMNHRITHLQISYGNESKVLGISNTIEIASLASNVKSILTYLCHK